MDETEKIIDFLNESLKARGLESTGAVEAAVLLDEAGLLIDDSSKPGEPLRDLLRTGAIAGASKESGRWVIRSTEKGGSAVIPESDSAASAAQESEAPDMTEGFAVRDGGDSLPSRLSIALRFVFSLFFLLVFEVVRLVLQVALLYQYVHLFATRRHSELVRTFCNRVTVYSYKILRYATLNENEKPFPLNSYPEDLEPPEAEVRFD